MPRSPVFVGDEMSYIPHKKLTMIKKIVIVSLVSILWVLVNSCGEKNQEQDKTLILKEIQLLIEQEDYEAARLVAIDALDPDIKILYYDADKRLGHASHLDVRCNERIEEILYEIVKTVPAKDTRSNRDIYTELLALYPENELYKKKFIYYDRKARGMIK